MRYKYIKVILDLIFSGELSGNLKGYQDLDPDWLVYFPIHYSMQQIMNKVYMKEKTIRDHNFILYGDNYSKKNWHYDYWDTDNLMDIVNGNFQFHVGLSGEVDEETEMFQTVVNIRSYKIENMYIDHFNSDLYIIKDGQFVWK